MGPPLGHGVFSPLHALSQASRIQIFQLFFLLHRWVPSQPLLPLNIGAPSFWTTSFYPVLLS